MAWTEGHVRNAFSTCGLFGPVENFTEIRTFRFMDGGALGPHLTLHLGFILASPQ